MWMRLHTHAVRLTGSLAASWQRCTRLSKVDLRTMCSAGISFCSTLSAGSCWRSWGKTRAQIKKVLTRYEAYVTVENRLLSHTNLHAGLLGGSRRDLGMVVGLRGLHGESHHRGSDGSWWSVVIRDLRTHNSERKVIHWNWAVLQIWFS